MRGLSNSCGIGTKNRTFRPRGPSYTEVLQSEAFISTVVGVEVAGVEMAGADGLGGK